MSCVIGLNFSHDTSVCIIKDGKIFAAEEERWSKIKHNSIEKKDSFLFPKKALEYCLKAANTTIEEADEIIGVSMHPKHFLGDGNEVVLSLLPKNIKKKIKFIRHHEAHIFSGYYLSPFKTAVGLCIDGAGSMLGLGINCRERISAFYLNNNESDMIYLSTQTIDFVKKKNCIKKIKIKHSLGNFYLNFANRVVEKGDEPEGTMMAMAAFSNGNKFYDEIKKLIEFKEEGQIRIKLNLGSKLENEIISIKDIKLNPNNVTQIPFEIRCDIAAAVQKVFEDAVIHICQHLKEKTKCDNLIFSGGCALNSKLNGELKKKSGFINVYVPPAPYDAGTALGAALYAWCKLLGNKKIKQPTCCDWGPSVNEEEIKKFDKNKYTIENNFSLREMARKVAFLLHQKKIVCFVYGNLEFGPRALGHRSILAHPGDEKVRDLVNKAKKRAYFRPLAPAVIEDEFNNWFLGDADYFMNKVAFTKIKYQNKICGVNHVDNSARVQLVSKENKGLYEVIKEFYALEKIPVLLNTSLNLKGKPIARTCEDALMVFENLNFDALIINNSIILKKPITLFVEKNFEKIGISNWSIDWQTKGKNALEIMYLVLHNKNRDQGSPFINHPLNVAEILLKEAKIHDEETIIYALIHDTIEQNKKVAIKLIDKNLGPQYSKGVWGLTKEHVAFNRKKTKNDDNKYFEKVSALPNKLFIVKLGDRLHNLREITLCKNSVKRDKFIFDLNNFYIPLSEKKSKQCREIKVLLNLIQKELCNLS